MITFKKKNKTPLSRFLIKLRLFFAKIKRNLPYLIQKAEPLILIAEFVKDFANNNVVNFTMTTLFARTENKADDLAWQAMRAALNALPLQYDDFSELSNCISNAEQKLEEGSILESAVDEEIFACFSRELVKINDENKANGVYQFWVQKALMQIAEKEGKTGITLEMTRQALEIALENLKVNETKVQSVGR